MNLNPNANETGINKPTVMQVDTTTVETSYSSGADGEREMVIDSGNELRVIYPEENNLVNYNPIFDKKQFQLKKHPLMFAGVLNLSFVMNYSDSSFPIKCRKCGNGFTRSPEGNNRYRFKCKSKAAKDKKCSCSCQAYDLKSYLIDLYNHDVVKIIKSDKANGPPYSLVFKKGQNQKVVPFGIDDSSRYEDDMKNPELVSPVFPNFQYIKKSKIKSVVDLRDIFWSEYDYILSEKDSRGDSSTDENYQNVTSLYLDGITTDNSLAGCSSVLSNGNSTTTNPKMGSLENFFQHQPFPHLPLTTTTTNIEMVPGIGNGHNMETGIGNGHNNVNNNNDATNVNGNYNSHNIHDIDEELPPVKVVSLEEFNHMRDYISNLNEKIDNSMNDIKLTFENFQLLLEKRDMQFKENLKVYLDSCFKNEEKSSTVVPSITFAMKASRKANTVARENAIVEHRKRVDQKIEEEKKKENNKCDQILRAIEENYEELPIGLKKLYDSGNLDKINVLLLV